MGTSKDLQFEKSLKNIIEKDRRYHIDAYLFIFEALEYTINRAGESRHVTGRELTEGIRDFLRERYGLLSVYLLKRWGIKKTIDFGEIVFNLVNNGLLRKTDTDNIGDFEEVFSLKEELYDNYDFNVKDLDISIRLKREPLVSE